MYPTILGIDIRESELRLGTVNEDSRLSSYETIPSKMIIDTGLEALTKLEELIHNRILNNIITPKAVSIGFPAMLNRMHWKLVSAPHMPGFCNQNIVSILEHKLSCPVYIARDAVMHFYYDKYFHKLPDNSIIISCYVGEGLGNVISIYGKILYGHNGSAAELGHIPVLGMEHPCHCGNNGCVEMLASLQALRRIAQTYYGDQDFSNIFLKHPDNAEVKMVVEAIAVAVAAEVNIIDPEFIVMGGEMLQMSGFPYDTLEQLIRFHTRKPSAWKLKIIYSEMASENAVKGAGLYGYTCMKIDGRL